MRSFLSLVAALAVLGFAGSAFAQQGDDTKTQLVEFDPEKLEGERLRPESTFVQSKDEAKFDHLRNIGKKNFFRKITTEPVD